MPPNTLTTLVTEFLTWSSKATDDAKDDDPVPGDWVAVNEGTGGAGLCRAATNELCNWFRSHGIKPRNVKEVHVRFDSRGVYCTGTPPFSLLRCVMVSRAFLKRYAQALKNADSNGESHVFALVCIATVWWVVDLTARQYDEDLPFPYYWPVVLS